MLASAHFDAEAAEAASRSGDCIAVVLRDDAGRQPVVVCEECHAVKVPRAHDGHQDETPGQSQSLNGGIGHEFLA
ncbi:MAG: hypothetical protein R3C02_04305 [Planctomycetaceae bacterium]